MASARSQVLEYITTQPKDEEGWVMKTGRDIAEALKMEPAKVFQIVGSLRGHGKVETKKRGNVVIGVRVIEGGKPRARATSPRRSAAVPTPLFGRSTSTPETDRYIAAKKRMEELKNDPSLAQFLSTSPELDAQPIYEEAATLKQRNIELERQLATQRDALRHEKSAREQEMRELEYLRKINNKEVQKALADSGVLVAHGD